MTKKTLGYSLIAIAMAVVLLALGVVSVFLPRKCTTIDMTSDKLYSFSDVTQRFLTSLDEEVTIYVIDSNMADKRFEDYIGRYASLSDKIKLEYVNSTEDQNVAALLSEYGYSASTPVSAYSLLISSAKRNYFMDYLNLFSYSNEALGFEGLSPTYYNYYLQLFSSSADYADYLVSLATDTQMMIHAEDMLNQMIEYVTADVIPQPYFVTGHGEDSTTDGNLAALLSYYGYAYGVYDITSGADIPADASCIVINAPTEDYTAAEADRILAYLKSGGHMLFIASSENASMPNVKSITEYYGFTLTSDTVLENKKAEEGEEVTVNATLTITLNIDHDVFATVGANTVSLVPPTAIRISDTLRPAQLVTPLLTSTSEAYIKDSEAKAPFTLGVAVEEESDAGNTKMVCLATASSINTDELTQAAITLPVCALSWMSEGFTNTVSEVAPKIYQDKPISIEQKQGLYFGAVFGIIVPAALIGIGVVLTKNRKKR